MKGIYIEIKNESDADFEEDGRFLENMAVYIEAFMKSKFQKRFQVNFGKLKGPIIFYYSDIIPISISLMKVC